MIIGKQSLITTAILSLLLTVLVSFSAKADFAMEVPVLPQSDPGAALSRGRALLKQGHADQALGYLETALQLYTQTNNPRGIAASEDALGDLYMIQGQNTVALAHYQKAYQSFVVARGQDATNSAAANSVASRAGATASAATETATSTADNGFNANLMLAKIGDTNYRLGRIQDASMAYLTMTVKKPETAGAKVARRFGGLGGVVSSIQTGNVGVATPTSSAIGLLETKKELDEYRVAIVYMTYELGTGRIAFANNEMETARKHFQNALDAGNGGLPGIANLGQTRRFRTAARTSLGDVALREGRFKDAEKMFTDAASGAQKDNRLDLMWPAKRGLGRSLWMQAGQDPKATKLRENALAAYNEALKTVETIRAGSLRADESRSTFLATTKDVYDEAATAFAEMALLNSSGGALSGKALEYAAESFRITEAGRARSLLDMLSEVNAQITEGVPPELLKRKQDNLDRQQEIAEVLTGVSVAADQKQKPSQMDSDLEKLQTEFDEIENQIRTASPRYAALTGAQPQTLSDVQQKVLDDGTVLLEYALGNDNSYLFAVTKSEVSLFKLPARSNLDKLAMDFRAQLIPPKLQRRLIGIDVVDEQRGLGLATGPSENLTAFASASNALYKAAVDPAAGVTADKRLLIVADGALNYVPFEALVKSTEGAEYASLNYLVKTNEIVYAPSASVVAAIRQSGGKGTGKNLLVVADPIFSADDPRVKFGGLQVSGDSRGLGLGLESAINDVTDSSAPAGGLRLARLVGTRTEAEEIGKIAKASGSQPDLWIDLNASEDNVRSRDMNNYRVIHVATHGLLDAQRPQFTGVVLSLVGNKSNDGFLRTDEIFNLRMNPSLVIL
jgi:CHAT domain-containing protein